MSIKQTMSTSSKPQTIPLGQFKFCKSIFLGSLHCFTKAFQNKKGQIKFQLPAVNKDTKNRAPGNSFGPSCFVTGLFTSMDFVPYTVII